MPQGMPRVGTPEAAWISKNRTSLRPEPEEPDERSGSGPPRKEKARGWRAFRTRLLTVFRLATGVGDGKKNPEGKRYEGHGGKAGREKQEAEKLEAGSGKEEAVAGRRGGFAVVASVTAAKRSSACDGGRHESGSCTYMMASRSHTLSIGVTGDLPGRVFQHTWREHEGFTARHCCDRSGWFEGHRDVHSAIDRETELKGWRRAKTIALIEAVHPTGADVSRDGYDLEPADYRRAPDRMHS